MLPVRQRSTEPGAYQGAGQDPHPLALIASRTLTLDLLSRLSAATYGMKRNRRKRGRPFLVLAHLLSGMTLPAFSYSPLAGTGPS